MRKEVGIYIMNTINQQEKRNLHDKANDEIQRIFGDNPIQIMEFLTMQRFKVAKSLGFDNIDDKAKYEEVITGDILGHEVFNKASGEVKGADARNLKTVEIVEYKKASLNKTKLENVLSAVTDGKKTHAAKMTYNGAGGTGRAEGAEKTRNIVDSYSVFGHYLSLFSEGECVLIAKINSDYVTSDNGLMKRVLLEEKNQKYSSTNGNSVLVHFENGGLKKGEGEIVYLNDIRTKSVLESFES